MPMLVKNISAVVMASALGNGGFEMNVVSARVMGCLTSKDDSIDAGEAKLSDEEVKMLYKKLQQQNMSGQEKPMEEIRRKYRVQEQFRKKMSTGKISDSDLSKYQKKIGGDFSQRIHKTGEPCKKKWQLQDKKHKLALSKITETDDELLNSQVWVQKHIRNQAWNEFLEGKPVKSILKTGKEKRNQAKHVKFNTEVKKATFKIQKDSKMARKRVIFRKNRKDKFYTKHTLGKGYVVTKRGAPGWVAGGTTTQWRPIPGYVQRRATNGYYTQVEGPIQKYSTKQWNKSPSSKLFNRATAENLGRGSAERVAQMTMNQKSAMKQQIVHRPMNQKSAMNQQKVTMKQQFVYRPMNQKSTLAHNDRVRQGPLGVGQGSVVFRSRVLRDIQEKQAPTSIQSTSVHPRKTVFRSKVIQEKQARNSQDRSNPYYRLSHQNRRSQQSARLYQNQQTRSNQVGLQQRQKIFSPIRQRQEIFSQNGGLLPPAKWWTPAIAVH